MIKLHEAIRKLNPEVVTITDEKAFDAAGKEIIYNKEEVELELAKGETK